jgi:Zn-dependent peptidase ImmA (M78 family)/transcriptional regulator with XRE-family HTH domain
LLINDQLKLARQQRGWTLDALSSVTGIPVSSLSEFETGKREPRLVHLEKLAKAYGRSLAGLLGDDTDGVGNAAAQMSAPAVVLWRQRPAAAETAAALEAKFLTLCHWYRNLEEWCDEKRPCLLPDAPQPRAAFDRSAAASLASLVRNQLSLGQQPAFSLLSVLESTCGVKVFHLDFEPARTAACTRSDELGMAILLNARNKRWRRNFDLAHELFHLLTWRVFRTHEGKPNNSARGASDAEERLANAFAACLLIPEEPLRLAVRSAAKSNGRLLPTEYFDLARQFDVSVDALLWRICEVFRRSANDTQHDLAQCRLLWPMHEVRSDSPPPPLPERYRALALRALQQGEFSSGRAAEYLGMTRHEVLALAEAPSVPEADGLRDTAVLGIGDEFDQGSFQESERFDDSTPFDAA